VNQPRDPGGDRPPSTIRQLRRTTFRGMDETQTLAVQALRELLDPDRDDWDELVAAYRASFVMCNTPVEVQFITSAGCLNYPLAIAEAS
jgi:hypothetical protein